MIGWGVMWLWALLAPVLFLSLRPAVAFSIVLIGGYLLLPAKIGYDLPVLPRLDRDSIPVLVALLMVLALGRRIAPGTGWLPRDPVLLVCLAFALFGGFGTALTNLDPIGGSFPREALRLYDGFNLGLTNLIMVLPFLLARRVLVSEEAQESFLRLYVIAACLYAVLALYEIRMSPQLHVMIYGFFQDSWVQHVRGDGFRPIVFLRHALWLAIFLATALLLAAGLSRTRGRMFLLATAWLFMVLVLAKSLGALVIVILLAPVALFLQQRMRLLVAAVIAGMILFYPVLRGVDVIPTDTIVSLASKVGPDRAASFATRVANENILLERASERPVFGWGSFGRERHYDEFGRSASISDGFWIITIGQGGWIKYFGVLGLLVWPILTLAFLRKAPSPLAVVTALALAANLLDLVPNATITPLTWMLAGALVAQTERRRAEIGEADALAEEIPPEKYRRVKLRRDPEEELAWVRRKPTTAPTERSTSRTRRDPQVLSRHQTTRFRPNG